MLRIPGRDNQPFFPLRKRNNTEFLARKLFTNERQIEFAGLWILQMRTGDVSLAFAHPGECQLARRCSRDNFHSADLFHHSRKQAGSGVAAS